MQNFFVKKEKGKTVQKKRRRSTVKAAQRKNHESHTGPNEMELESSLSPLNDSRPDGSTETNRRDGARVLSSCILGRSW